jgi:AcrR family transcriptional regulator
MSKRVNSHRGGRPLGFNRSQALQTSMELFWKRGYEGVSIADLTKAIDIAPTSLYQAFGSKADLFREALGLYESTVGPDVREKMETATDVETWVRTRLEVAARSAAFNRRACLVSSGMIMCHPNHQALADSLSERRTAFRKKIEKGLSRWLSQDQARDLARFLATVVQGMSVQARDGADLRALLSIVDISIKAIAQFCH